MWRSSDDIEKSLFEKISKGDERAFKLLYDTYFGRIYAFAFKILKHEDITKEVVHDVFIKIWIARISLNDVVSPRSYIYTLTRNRALDDLRKLSKERLLADSIEDKIIKSPHEADNKVNAEELKLQIFAALNNLSDKKQKVFKMSKYDGFSHDEIASELKLSKSTVKNHLSETLQYLKEQLKFT